MDNKPVERLALQHFEKGALGPRLRARKHAGGLDFLEYARVSAHYYGTSAATITVWPLAGHAVIALSPVER